MSATFKYFARDFRRVMRVSHTKIAIDNQGGKMRIRMMNKPDGEMANPAVLWKYASLLINDYP